MNKFVKWGLVGYGALIVAKGVQIALANRSLAQKEVEEVFGYEVIRGNELMKAQGMKIAGAFIFTDGSKKIIVDDTFFTFSDTVQQAILAHEQAHIDLGHLDNMTGTNNAKRALIALSGGVQDIELEADACAVEKVGKHVMVLALTKLLTVRGVNKKEIRRRITAIKALA